MFCFLWLRWIFFNGRSTFHFSKKTKKRYQPNYFWPCWLITVNLVKSHNFLLILKFKPKSWVCSFFSIRRYKNRPEMMSLRILRFKQDSINSQNFIPYNVSNNDVIDKSSIQNFYISSTKNDYRKFHAYRACDSRVIAYVLFIFWILEIDYDSKWHHFRSILVSTDAEKTTNSRLWSPKFVGPCNKVPYF